LTFPQGAQLSDPKQLFDTHLESKTVRADFREGEAIDGSHVLAARGGMGARGSAAPAPATF
jgi:hypothetical protein